MLKLSQTCPRPAQPNSENVSMDVLQDFLELRTELPEKKRRGLLGQLKHLLDLSGDIKALPAFMVGAQAVLCIKDDTPETCWVYNPKIECLRPWKENTRVPEAME